MRPRAPRALIRRAPLGPGGTLRAEQHPRVGFAYAARVAYARSDHGARGALEWQEVILDGIHVRVATPRMLYRMKRDTVRPQDKIDSSVLRERFELEDE